MLIILSPAKKLDLSSQYHVPTHTQALFTTQAESLIHTLRQMSISEIQALMDLSPALAQLNHERYMQWSVEHNTGNAKPAVLLFDGDVYEGLEAHTFDDDQLLWAQHHLIILSGLYGLLRPLDLMQAYRLEMGTRLSTPKGKNLYDFWGMTQTEYLAQQPQQVVVNLASEEYAKVIQFKHVNKKIVECVFQDLKNDQYKIISFYAKRARGLMAKYIIQNQITTINDLKQFHAEGYVFSPEVSSELRLVFRRALVQ